MHTQTMLSERGSTRERRGLLSALRRHRRHWRHKRRAVHVARRLGLTYSQRDHLTALLQTADAGRERLRANLAELAPQLDELLLQGDASRETVAAMLRGGLRLLDDEVDAVAQRLGEFLESLNAAQRNVIRDALQQRLI